jgi:hypothetical protein
VQDDQYGYLGQVVAGMVEAVVVQCLVVVRLRPRAQPGVPAPKPTSSRYNRSQNWAAKQRVERQARAKGEGKGGGKGRGQVTTEHGSQPSTSQRGSSGSWESWGRHR